jgi:hypothetical protein
MKENAEKFRVWIRPSSTSSCAKAPSKCSVCDSRCRWARWMESRKSRAAQAARSYSYGSEAEGRGSFGAAAAPAPWLKKYQEGCGKAAGCKASRPPRAR